MTNIGIILGGTRPGRVGHQVAEWVAEQGSQHDGIDVEVVDIDDFGLPVFDEPQSPLLGSYAHAHTRKWSNKAAGFVSYGSNVGGARAVEPCSASLPQGGLDRGADRGGRAAALGASHRAGPA